MRAVSKPFFRQRRVGSGLPGNGVVRQSANAHSSEGTGATPPLTPVFDSEVLEISVACFVSRLAGVRPGPGREAVFMFAEKFTCSYPGTPAAKRTVTGPVTEDPSAFLAIGTSIASRPS